MTSPPLTTRERESSQHSNKRGKKTEKDRDGERPNLGEKTFPNRGIPLTHVIYSSSWFEFTLKFLRR